MRDAVAEARLTAGQLAAHEYLQIETTFVFKVDGDKLTGTTSNQMSGELPISDGKIDGDNLSFTVTANFNGNEFKLNYKGRVAGNEIKLTLSVPQRDRTFELIAKRVS